MTELAPLSLDDLTYEDLRELAMRRIPAASGGRWTHHEPVDSGVTLIELFAFLLDQQIFVLDQVPESLTLAILALLDEAPKPAGVSRTVVAPPLPVADAIPPHPAVAPGLLPAGSVLRPQAFDGGTLAISTRDDVYLLPVRALGVLDGDVSLSDRLERGEAVPVMTSTAGPATLTIDLDFDAAIGAEAAGQPVAFALRFASETPPPEWSADATDVPPPVALTLTWTVPDGPEGNIADWQDGTGGLRRSGLIRCDLPAEAVGADRLRLTLATEAASFAEPPVLKSVSAGAVIADHRRRIDIPDAPPDAPNPTPLQRDLIAAAAALLPISGQQLALPVSEAPQLADGMVLRLGDRAGNVHDWHPVADLSPQKKTARVFRFDRDRGLCLFGDGYTGRVPAPVTSIGATFDVGGGIEGNHPAKLLWQTEAGGNALTLTSITDGIDGAPPEPLEEARGRVAASLARRHRAVTAEDYKTLIETAPGLAAHRALVMPGFDPNFPCAEVADSVTVFVVPRTGPDATEPKADDGALTVFRDTLDRARMLTTRVFVRRALFRPVGLDVEIAATTGTARTFVELLRPRLTEYLHPALGGPDGDGWPFGGALRPSELLRVADAVLGEGVRAERIIVRLLDTGATQDCTELPIAPTDLVALSALTVRVTGKPPAEATL